MCVSVSEEWGEKAKEKYPERLVWYKGLSGAGLLVKLLVVAV